MQPNAGETPGRIEEPVFHRCGPSWHEGLVEFIADAVQGSPQRATAGTGRAGQKEGQHKVLHEVGNRAGQGRSQLRQAGLMGEEENESSPDPDGEPADGGGDEGMAVSKSKH